MAYQIIALKWRPQNFDEVIGQGHITAILKNSILKERLANAYLFAGPHGVGKTSTARILAKSLNCKQGPTITPCQKCASCIEVSQSRSLDVIEIDGASNRGIDEIRTLRENVKFSPTANRFKIYIIDEVHMLTTEAFNALLKTLEEPPEFVKFIFATTQPHKVLPTVLSRCQRLNFKRIPLIKIMEQLEKIISKEKIDIDEKVIFSIGKASQGSLRDAESILDQLISFGKGKLSVNDVVSVLGLIKQEILFEVTDTIIKKDAKRTIELLNKIIEEGKDTTIFLINLIEHFRNLMIAKVSQADQELIDLPADVCERLYKQSEFFTLEEIMHFFTILVNAQELMKRLSSSRIPLEINLVKLTQEKKAIASSPASGASLGPAKEEKVIPIQKSERRAKDKSNNPKVNNYNVSKEITIENITNCWHKVIENLKGIKMSVATYLEEAQLVSMGEGVLILSFPKNYSLHKEVLEKNENRSLIEEAIRTYLGEKIRLKFILSENVIHKEKEAQNSPLVKSVLNIFNAKPIFD